MPSEKYEYPRCKSQWLHGSIAAPSRIPIATRPLGPIQLLSNAYFRKKVTALISARIPMRFSQRPPMSVSKSRIEELFCCELCSGGAAKTLNSGGGKGTSRGLGISFDFTGIGGAAGRGASICAGSGDWLGGAGSCTEGATAAVPRDS